MASMWPWPFNLTIHSVYLCAQLRPLTFRPVFDLSGGGLTPTGRMTTPPHWWLQSLVWGVGFDPPQKVKNLNSSLNRYKLLSDIIQTLTKNSFYNDQYSVG